MSIRQLKEIHSATHPAQLQKDKSPVNGNSQVAELLATLDAEAKQDKEEG